jgi:hypothetical protein
MIISRLTKNPGKFLLFHTQLKKSVNLFKTQFGSKYPTAKTKRSRLCVPKTLSALIGRRNFLTSAHHDCAVVFRPGRFGLAVQVEEPA